MRKQTAASAGIPPLQNDQRQCPSCLAVIERQAPGCKYCRKVFSAQELLGPNQPTKADRPVNQKFWKMVGIIMLCTFGLVGVLSALGIKPDKVDREYASHCASGWDGSASYVVAHVKARMRDPGSFEHVESLFGRTKAGTNGVIMTYRGRNGFGAMTLESAIVRINNDDCRVARDQS